MLKLRLTIGLILLGLVCFALAQPNNQPKGQNKTHPSKYQQTGTEKKPLFVKIVPPQKTEAETKQEQENRNSQLRAETAKQKTDDSLVSFTGSLADYTLALVGVGILQALILIAQIILFCRQEKATKTIERAYIAMSHTEEALRIDRATGEFKLTIVVQNYGRTPGRVSSVFLNDLAILRDERLPIPPDYDKSLHPTAPIKAFLLTNSWVLAHFSGTIDDWPSVLDGTKKLYMYGYVDYVDQFGDAYRGGYARVFNLDRAIDNLEVAPNGKYNYDYKRQKNRDDEW